MRWRWLVALAIASCGGPHTGGAHFLGAPVPAACRERAVEPCIAAIHTLQKAARLELTDAPALQEYVQGVVDRLARHTRLGRAPRVWLEELGRRAYVTYGGRLAVPRNVLGWVGSEAELAALLAHELVHLEGEHASLALARVHKDEVWYAARRDAEGIAEERALELVVRAGYPADTMVRLYERVVHEQGEEMNDEQYPSVDVSMQRVRALAAGRAGGVDGRATLLRHTAGLVIGLDPRSGTRVGDAWVIPRLGLAVASPGEIERSTASHRVLTTLPDRYAIDLASRAWGRELARALLDRETRRTTVGPVTVGVMPNLPVRDHEPVALDLDTRRDQVTRPAGGAVVLIVDRPAGALVIELSAIASPATIEAVLAALRAPTPAELAAALPARIVLATAPRTAPLRELVTACVDPEAAIQLDDDDRVVHQGEPFKCTDRVLPD